MNRFIVKYADRIRGKLSGFDRLVRGTLQPDRLPVWHGRVNPSRTPGGVRRPSAAGCACCAPTISFARFLEVIVIRSPPPEGRLAWA